MIRFIRKRDQDVLELVTEITDIKNLTVENNTESSVNALVNGVGNGNCQKGRCGPEAACKPLHNNRYMCVCPHDSSPPTVDLRCPNRLTVPITPKPIHNIIPPGGSNDTVNVTTVMHTSSQRTLISEESIYHNDMKIFIIGSALTVVLVIFFIVFWCKRRALAKLVGIETSNKVPLSPSPLKKSILLSERYTINTQYSPCLTYTVPLIQSDTLTFLDEIGEGCFGKVFKGELRREGSDHVEIVAIKVLKDSVSRKAEEDFMREVDVMSAFRHENILSLIGIVIKDPGLNPIMVFEYMDYGDLAEVLRQNSRSYNTIDSKHKTSILDKRELLSIALQIAAGMRYLAAQRFVHRDLACRNCLVAQGLVVKIADFGMSRDVYTCDYYKIGGSRLLPVRWMSPESVMYGKFTLESDIWSYGVVMWEIYSYGKQPYFGHTNEEVVQLILHGTMLNLPDDCPPLISKLIHSCWRVEPRDRIPFTEIYDELHSAYECYEDKNISVQLNVPCDREESKEKSNKVILLPRPPLEPIAQLADLLDSDGYLLPQEATRVNYLQTVSD